MKTPAKEWASVRIEKKVHESLKYFQKLYDSESISDTIRRLIPVLKMELFRTINGHFSKIINTMEANELIIENYDLIHELTTEFAPMITTLVLNKSIKESKLMAEKLRKVIKGEKNG